MHVAILNQTFHPDVAATGQLMWDVARHLEKSGERVSVITSRSFYGTDRRHEKAFERFGAVDVHRVGGTALGKRSIATRLADFASFYVSAAWRLQHLPHIDVILVLTSPPLVASLAMLQKQFSAGKVGVVYHVMDLYPDAAVAMELFKTGSPLHAVLKRITARTLQTSDAIIALGRDMREHLLQHYPVKPEKIFVVTPWADGAALSPIDKAANPLARRLQLEQTFNVVYSGNLGAAHDVPTLISAIDHFRGDDGIRFLFIGGGSRTDALRRVARQREWSHVVFLPFTPREELNQSLNLADVHLVSQLPQFTGLVVPSKLFGILAVGRPSIMIGPKAAECSRIIEENAAGFVVPNGDDAKLIEAIRALRGDRRLALQMGARARRAFETQYDQPIACARIETILRAAL